VRKVYSDPALKDNKKWTIYTTQTLYKEYLLANLTSDYGLMNMANEALTTYIAIFPDIAKLNDEAQERAMPLHEYIKEIINNRK
jgi:hypothetical protein